MQHLVDLYKSSFSVKNEFSGEVQGPCPKCGGIDRFIVRWNGGKYDRQCYDLGSFFCKKCDISGKTSGNAITYLMAVDGLTYPEACEQVGFQLPENGRKNGTRGKSPVRGKGKQGEVAAGSSYVWYPGGTVHDAVVKDPEAWEKHAEKFVAGCHEEILDRPQALQWFEERGVDLDAVKKYRLGWNNGYHNKKKGIEHMPSFKMSAAWGMPSLPDYKDGKKQDKIMLYAGLVMPCYVAGKLARIQIVRKFDGAKRLVIGSIGFSGAQWVMNPGQEVAYVCENERDGMAVAACCPGVTVVPIGSVRCKPCRVTHEELRGKKLILMSLDADKSSTPEKLSEFRKKWAVDHPGVPCPVWVMGAGVQAVDWWFEMYEQAEPWVIPGYNDPGEAFEDGFDVAGWVKSGIEYYLPVNGKKEAELGDQVDCDEPVKATLRLFCRLAHKRGLAVIKGSSDPRDVEFSPDPWNNLLRIYDDPGFVEDLRLLNGLLWGKEIMCYLELLSVGEWSVVDIWNFFMGEYE